MTDELKELLAKVEAGSCENDGSMYRSFGDNWTHCFDAYNGSLDAAKALHEAVLHECVSKEETWSKRYGGVVVLRDGKAIIGTGTDVCETPARAWLTAIIKALIAVEASE